jgi:hypothetical protein
MNLILIWFLGSAIKYASNMKTYTSFIGRVGPDGELFYRYSICNLGYCVLFLYIY